MKPTILSLADPRADLETVGGKGMSLARMSRAGLPVPGGFHITTEAYRHFVAENRLQERILAAIDGLDPNNTAMLDRASQSIAAAFTAGDISPELAEAISGAYQPYTAVAVRSSATAEDLPDASFAGQQNTYLNIRGAGAVLNAVRDCWASLWTARAIAYRIQNHIDQAAVTLAVVVQELVFADAAGILFTANPVNGRRRQSVINAAWGLGEAVVSGAVTPDTLTVDNVTHKVINRVTADKQLMTVRTEAGTHEQPVPASLRKKAVLRDSQAAALTAIGRQIETYYGMPMDIEWTLAGGKFAVVQARPITAIPAEPVEWVLPDPKALYGRGSLAEHIPSPVTPLFATLGLELANQATDWLWKDFMKIHHHDLFEGGFYKAINGYVYGGFRTRLKDWGLILKISFSQMGSVFRASTVRWQAARQKLAAVVEHWEHKPVENLSPSDLLAGVRAVFGEACLYFTTIQTTLPAASFSETFFTQYYTRMLKRKDGPDASAFLLGFDTISLCSEKSLYDLAMWVKARPDMHDYLQEHAAAEIAEALQSAAAPVDIFAAEWDEWRTRFNDYLRTFGRTAYEFDFVNPTPAETPATSLDAIKAFIDGKAANPYQRQQASIERREAATRAVLQRSRWPLKNLFVSLLKWAQETGPVREDSIAEMGLGHPQVRRFLLELGRRFTAGGAIQQPADIFWLEKAEVEQLVNALEHAEPLPDLCDRVPLRKAGHKAALQLNAPVMLPERSRMAKLYSREATKNEAGKIVLKGEGTSRGKVSAPACVLFSPEDFGKMRPGDVLVAVTTTPAWTPLFAMASAVVTDIGGPLSHSSIVAREYGIPAIMATRTATRAIRDGQMISVDGAAGTITLED